MMKTQIKDIDMKQLREYNTNRILSNNFQAIPINVKLASNPYLKDQQKYHYLIYKLNQYNKKINLNQITDPYEAMYYENLHTIVCDLAYIDTKADQLVRLQEVFKWAKEQEHFVQQRRDQGQVRYQVTKEVRYGVEPEKKESNVSQKTTADEIPSQTIAKALLPFKNKWRTAHKQLDIPARRLQEYKKRKILNIAPYIQPKQQKKGPRVTYPRIPKLQYKIQQPQEPQQVQEGQQNQAVPQDGAVPGVEGEVKPGEEKEVQNAADQQQDLGGFGEEPAEPEEEQPPQQDGQDKLAPKLKNYAIQFKDIKRKEYKGPYLFYKGEDYEIERRMEEKYLKIHHDQLKKQKQDKQAIQMIEQWAAKRSKMEKQHQKRLENGVFTSKYLISNEEPPKAQMLNAADQLRFGFTQNLRRPKMAQIQLNTSYLPKIVQQKMFQKSIRKDRLNSLKGKFGKLLNLQDYQERETSQSLCQYSSRKRGLSQIIKNHSKSKQRINQLDQVVRIKQKLARNKVGIDVRSLSMGLCVPEDEQAPQIIFPDKSLPSNPLMVETKKKKKKK